MNAGATLPDWLVRRTAQLEAQNEMFAAQGEFADGATRYLTHDNGGRMFLVTHQSSGQCTVHKRPHNVFSEHVRAYTVAVWESSALVRRVLAGVAQSDYPNFSGNSVLIEEASGRYIFVGHTVYAFECNNGAAITNLYSYVGNSDVPYPVAVSETAVYFMLDHVTVPRHCFGDFTNWLDGYQYFYDTLKCPKEPKFSGLAILCERLC